MYPNVSRKSESIQSAFYILALSFGINCLVYICQWILDEQTLTFVDEVFYKFLLKIGGWRQWRLEDFYYLELASHSKMIIAWEATICVPIKPRLGKLIPEDKRGLDRFVSLKKRGGLVA